MFPDSSDSRLLVLGRDPDTDLLSLLRAWHPNCRFALERGELSDWLGDLWRKPPQGLLIFTESLDLQAVPALRAWLLEYPDLPVLLFTGTRGLIGIEELLQHPTVRLLPLPWTIDALRQVVGRPRTSAQTSASDQATSNQAVGNPPPPAARRANEGEESAPPITSTTELPSSEPASDGAFAEGFLDGLVERFRDPLASLSGYLQLLRGDAGSDPLVQPALAAARELDLALESLQLASEAHHLHPSRVLAQNLVVQALKRAQEGGVEVQYSGQDPLVSLRVDTRLVEAALDTGRLLLERFGGGGALELCVLRDPQQLCIGWQLQPDLQRGALANHSGVEAPPFLEMLLARFAQRVGARLIVSRAAGVARAVQLAWPSDALRAVQPA